MCAPFSSQISIVLYFTFTKHSYSKKKSIRGVISKLTSLNHVPTSAFQSGRISTLGLNYPATPGKKV
jgi:hypothetical protein